MYSLEYLEDSPPFLNVYTFLTRFHLDIFSLCSCSLFRWVTCASVCSQRSYLFCSSLIFFFINYGYPPKQFKTRFQIWAVLVQSTIWGIICYLIYQTAHITLPWWKLPYFSSCGVTGEYLWPSSVFWNSIVLLFLFQ